jgi:hypothetical protein
LAQQKIYCGCSGLHRAGASISYRIGPSHDAIVSLIVKQPGQLSGGQEQRAAIARGIVTDQPECVIWIRVGTPELGETHMKVLLGCLMLSNAILFFFGAIQHAGVSLGHFHEPRIIPAAIVETICGMFLAWGATAVFGRIGSSFARCAHR